MRGEGLPLSSFGWKCDSKFGVDSATDSTRSGFQHCDCVASDSIFIFSRKGNARVQEVIDRVERLLVQRHWPNRKGK
jgi:hypothetical protein